MAKILDKQLHLPMRPMSARSADAILDHLSLMVREAGRDGGGIERIQGWVFGTGPKEFALSSLKQQVFHRSKNAPSVC